MKLNLTILALLIAANTYGQITQSPISLNQGKLQIGIVFSPDLNFRTLKNNDGSAASSTEIEMRNSNEKAKFGYTAGVNACYNITPNWSIEAGIQYSQKGYQTKENHYIMIEPEPGVPEKTRYIHNFYYTDLPIKVNYMAGVGKIRFITSAGITTNYFIKEMQTQKDSYADGTIKRHSREVTEFTYNTVNITPTISAGIDYQITNQLNIRVEPVFRYGALKIIDTPITAHLWNTGVNFGCYFRL